jgi:hypothetical protein
VYIRNQCLDLELVSPTCFGRNAIWHILPDQKVEMNAATRAVFGKDITKCEFTSALIYELQRKNHNSNYQFAVNNTENTSTGVQLLVIWRFDNSYNFYVNAMLVKHKNTTTWDEDKLKRLHFMYFTLHRNGHIKDTWLLDDATVLMTTLKWGEASHIREITIFEGARMDDSMESLWAPLSD